MASDRSIRETAPAIPTILRETNATLGDLHRMLAALVEKHIALKNQNCQPHKKCWALEGLNTQCENLYSHAPIGSVLLDSTPQQHIQCNTAPQPHATHPHLGSASKHSLPSDCRALSQTELERELEQKEQDLRMLALQCLEQREKFAMLERQLKKASWVSPSQSRQLIQTMLRDIQESVEQHSAWQRVEQHFGKGTRHFLNTLARLYPHLTPAELKICNLIRLTMSTKEIASILHTSPKTIENQRYRIRKKLGLSVEQLLGSFLMAL